MSSYEFQAISDIESIAAAHAKRGYRVLLVGEAWTCVQALAKKMGVPPNKADTLVVTSLARQIHECRKKGGELFDQNTLVVVSEPVGEHGADTAWARVREAALVSSNEVVFAHLPVRAA